jgi:hypothetical protein
MQDQTGTSSTRAKTERHYTAHDLLGEVLRDYPDATDTKRRAVFVSLARDNDGIATQIIGAWFDRYNSRHRYDSETAQKRRDRREEQQERAQARAVEAEKIASTVREMILLDMITPNGKKLRDLTGRECGELGGWFGKLAVKVKATQKVGTVLTEPQLRELWAA